MSVNICLAPCRSFGIQVLGGSDGTFSQNSVVFLCLTSTGSPRMNWRVRL
jgi:hypothetical protein